jgi:LAO/AO transport system kinase
MVDFFLVLLIAGAGDELQGIKRGILEVADMLAINKADGDNRGRATRAQASYQSALRLMRGDSMPPVVTCSALEKTGLNELWALVAESRRDLEASGEFQRKRQAQQVQWMWDMVEDGSAAALQVLLRFAERAGDALTRD